VHGPADAVAHAITQHQVDLAIAAIENVHGCRPSSGTQYADEERLRMAMRRA
jgi:hypothetical protein